MRWKQPKDGDVKIKKIFALFPITSNGETRWLEWVNVECEYCSDLFESYWRIKRFIDEEVELNSCSKE